jgi:hypothetical protein
MKDRIAFLSLAVRLADQAKESIEGGELRGMGKILDDIWTDIQELETELGKEGNHEALSEDDQAGVGV